MSFQVKSVAEAIALGDVLIEAGNLLPKGITKKGEVVAIVVAGMELGLPPMVALRTIQIVRGKVIIDYSAQVGLLRRAGYRIEWPRKTPESVTIKLTSPAGDTHEETWDVERAKRAKLWGNQGPWREHSETMLSARCVSSAARAFAADVLAGVYVPGELPGDATEPEVPEEQPAQAQVDQARVVAAVNGVEAAADAEAAILASKDAVDLAGAFAQLKALPNRAEQRRLWPLFKRRCHELGVDVATAQGGTK